MNDGERLAAFEKMYRNIRERYADTERKMEALKAQGKNPFTLTSKPGDGTYQEFLKNETRYSRLTRAFPDRAEKLFQKADETAQARYEHLLKLVELYK